jgi:hypothetical protein
MWLLNKRDNQRIEVAQMKFLKPLLGFIKLDHQRNTDISEKQQLQNIVEEIPIRRQKGRIEGKPEK